LQPIISLGWINVLRSKSHDLAVVSGEAQKSNATAQRSVRSRELMACGAKKAVIS